MSEHQKETEFLRHCLGYDNSARHQELDKKISQIQRDERCDRRAVWHMAVLAALIVAGLGYPALLIENFPFNTPQFIMNIISALGLASLICLVVFVGLRMVYRMKLDQRREECRQLVAKLLESRLGKLVTTPWHESRLGNMNRGTVQVAAGSNGAPNKTESTARG
jgi:hypothetical protein